MIGKSEAFRRSLRAFVHRAGLAAGVDLVRPDLEDEARREQVRRFERIPIDPEALLLLARRWGQPDQLDAFERWADAHARILVPKRVTSLASSLSIGGELLTASPTRRTKGDLKLRRPSNVWARARLGFGLGARAAVVATVCEAPRSTHPVWRIAVDSGLTERAIRDAVNDLGALGFVQASKRGATAAKFAPALDAIREPAPQLRGRSWPTLLRFIEAAAREFERADVDPVGLNDPAGELGGRKRLRRAALDASIRPIAEMTDPSGAYRDPDPLAAPLDATRRFLELLDGW